MSDPQFPNELRRALRGLAGSVTASSDQAAAMTDAELAGLLLTGRWTTIEVHEAGRRLAEADDVIAHWRRRAETAEARLRVADALLREYEEHAERCQVCVPHSRTECDFGSSDG